MPYAADRKARSRGAELSCSGAAGALEVGLRGADDRVPGMGRFARLRGDAGVAVVDLQAVAGDGAAGAEVPGDAAEAVRAASLTLARGPAMRPGHMMMD